LSLQYKNAIDDACDNLHGYVGLDYFVMYILFNNGTKMVLSNIYQQLIPYHVDGYKNEDYTTDPEIINNRDHFLCNQVNSVSERYKDALENKFKAHRIYYTVRNSPECDFVFGALTNRNINDHEGFYLRTINGFNNFCNVFVDSLLNIILDCNPHYKKSFILTNHKLRHDIINGTHAKNNQLTEREIDCLWLASQGKSAKEIARKLLISPFTVDRHLKNIREKWQCSSLIEAIIEGINKGVIGRMNVFGSKL